MTFTDEDHNWVKGIFPGLDRNTFEVTSPRNKKYNCIGWAAGDDKNWWWPDGVNYWPAGLPMKDSVDNFVATFAQFGFEKCADGAQEAGYEKVVIYAVDGRATHMARQLPDGAWTSKLGRAFDIRHGAAIDVNGDAYGEAVQHLRRKIPASPDTAAQVAQPADDKGPIDSRTDAH